MACFRPCDAWLPIDGSQLRFHEVKDSRHILIPCGRCIGCRIRRQDAWMIRMMCEAKCHQVNSFITLTYDDEHLPYQCSLDYRDWQLFAKRLRKRFRFRYFVAGEYGSENSRPHMHAVLFGLSFPDAVRLKSLDATKQLYTSKILSETWGKGFVSIGDVNATTCRYVAKYCLKKWTGPDADQHYTRVDLRTGEIVTVAPEFGHMSLRPGIGASWISKYWPEVAAYDGAVVMDGRVKPAPAYFMDKLNLYAAFDRMDEIEFSKYKAAMLHSGDSTPERLAVREQVEHARQKFNNERKVSHDI